MATFAPSSIWSCAYADRGVCRTRPSPRWQTLGLVGAQPVRLPSAAETAQAHAGGLYDGEAVHMHRVASRCLVFEGAVVVHADWSTPFLSHGQPICTTLQKLAILILHVSGSNCFSFKAFRAEKALAKSGQCMSLCKWVNGKALPCWNTSALMPWMKRCSGVKSHMSLKRIRSFFVLGISRGRGHVWVSQVNQHRWGTGDVGKCEPVREPVRVCIYGEQIFAYWWWTGADWILLWVLCCLFCFLPINFSIQVQSSLKFVKCSVSIRLCESQRCFVCRAVQNCRGCSGWFTCK